MPVINAAACLGYGFWTKAGIVQGMNASFTLSEGIIKRLTLAAIYSAWLLITRLFIEAWRLTHASIYSKMPWRSS